MDHQSMTSHIPPTKFRAAFACPLCLQTYQACCICRRGFVQKGKRKKHSCTATYTTDSACSFGAFTAGGDVARRLCNPVGRFSHMREWLHSRMHGFRAALLHSTRIAARAWRRTHASKFSRKIFVKPAKFHQSLEEVLYIDWVLEIEKER